jgi:hypothetical protein
VPGGFLCGIVITPRRIAMTVPRSAVLVLLPTLALAAGLLAGCGPGTPVPATPEPSGSEEATSTPGPGDGDGADTGTDTDTDPDPADPRADIVDAVTSGNAAALRDLFAPSVHVTYAASEDEGDVTNPDLLVTNVANATSPTATWDFDLPASVVENYRNNPGSAGAYVDDFPVGAIVGKSSENKVISFAVSAGLITRLFIANDEYALIFE